MNEDNKIAEELIEFLEKSYGRLFTDLEKKIIKAYFKKEPIKKTGSKK